MNSQNKQHQHVQQSGSFTAQKKARVLVAKPQAHVDAARVRERVRIRLKKSLAYLATR
jgi:hypothetical protein